MEQPQFSRKLRLDATRAEKILWSRLRDKQFFGLKFRRQHPFDAYTLDFYCAAMKLVVELDGDSHFVEDGPAKDIERTRYLEAKGLRVLRYTNLDVIGNSDGVLENLAERLGLVWEG